LRYAHTGIHFVNERISQKVSCLCCLDLSVAFDTIDHNILITRPSSWFGIHGSVLCWFKSFLSSRSFHVICDNNLPFLHTPSCGVPRGSVLSPLLYIMYTTPLSTLISCFSLDHHLYADDTQLFFFFHPFNFDTSISHLQNSLQQISSSTTANLVTLNSSKTEFLLIRLKNQLTTFSQTAFTDCGLLPGPFLLSCFLTCFFRSLL